eukprot:GHVU01133860.1.p1 GENE.GHVU01133860.1~~GHVU01133860.1.p1  ORF type:complete len:179 (+),score=30.90 GHVU01133860.1:312-848(+)
MTETAGAFVRRMRELLQLEADEEARQLDEIYVAVADKAELQARGLVLLRLESEHDSVSNSQIMVRFHPKNIGGNKEADKKRAGGSGGRGQPVLPEHRMTTGSIVGVFEGTGRIGGSPLVQGVVARSDARGLLVAFPEAASEKELCEFVDQRPVDVALLSSEVTMRRLYRALDAIERGE